jgi:hypothetical protein
MIFSWRLWRLLHKVPVRWELKKLLLPKHYNFSDWSPREFPLMLLPWLYLCAMLPFLLIPLTTTFLCLRLAWQISAALNRHHELDRHELLAVTPIGDFGVIMEIGRIYCGVLIPFARTMYFSGMFFAVFILASITLISPSLFFAGLLAIVSTACLTVLDFRQTLVISFLIGVRASFLGDNLITRLWILGVGLMWQIASYSLIMFLFIGFSQFAQQKAVAGAMNFAIMGALIGALAISYLLRELVVMWLWNALRWRLNDDVPAFRVMIGQNREHA